MRILGVIVLEIIDIYRFNISHLSNDDITSLWERFVQDIYGFFSDVLNKVGEFVAPVLIWQKESYTD